MIAKTREISHFSALGAAAFGAISQPLAQDRRKIALWVPGEKFYGGSRSKPPPILVGFDSEWKQEGGGNRILSYQFFALKPPASEWSGIKLCKGRQRMSLAQFLALVIGRGIEGGHLKKWPKKIWLCGHFSFADLNALSDFSFLKKYFDAVRRTYVTIGNSTEVVLWDLQRHAHEVAVTLRDSMLLAPGGKQGLKELGSLLGVKKIELKEGEIENMDKLLEEDTPRFEEYALRDAEVSVKYCQRMQTLNFQLTGSDDIPPTLSSIGVTYLLKLWKDAGIDVCDVLGTEWVKEEVWDKVRRCKIKRTRMVPTADRNTFESLATECYHGGRNEQYQFGAGRESAWTDFDLCGAYTTAMALISMPQWEEMLQTRDVDDFQPERMGYARVKFRFPSDTRFPCLPVRTANGLVFTLSGESYCCSPEIYLARKMGADLQIVHGVILPCEFEERPFERFIVECTTRRKSFEKGSLDELFWKELGNGTYGKTAQGLREKRCFNSRSGETEALPPSRISNPYFAAYVTSIVRAALSEILALLPAHVEVFNATTDGFLATATQPEAVAASQGPICDLFARARYRITNNSTVIEAKHKIAQPLGWRTRGQATLQSLPGEKTVLAKAGLKPPMKDKDEQNHWIVQQFQTRTPESKQTLQLLRTLPEIWKKGGDLVSRELIRRLNMDYDWKRRPINPSMRPVQGVDHLFFETRPWESVEEFQKCREQWDAFQSHGGRVLKSLPDLENFDEFRRINVGGTRLKRPRRDASLKIAWRMFLRAYVRSLWGLDGKTKSYAELALWLTTNGYPTKKEDLENAARPTSKLVENLVPPTGGVEKFLAVVEKEFPDFQRGMLLTQ
ncbi:MAG: hypothetical protein HY360_09435 [Verrucomicrobia bacterium]|nr:hypothetical protein [Verrucomicrobiota bacterium]